MRHRQDIMNERSLGSDGLTQENGTRMVCGLGISTACGDRSLCATMLGPLRPEVTPRRTAFQDMSGSTVEALTARSLGVQCTQVLKAWFILEIFLICKKILV